MKSKNNSKQSTNSNFGFWLMIGVLIGVAIGEFMPTLGIEIGIPVGMLIGIVLYEFGKAGRNLKKN